VAGAGGADFVRRSHGCAGQEVQGLGFCGFVGRTSPLTDKPPGGKTSGGFFVMPTPLSQPFDRPLVLRPRDEVLRTSAKSRRFGTQASCQPPAAGSGDPAGALAEPFDPSAKLRAGFAQDRPQDEAYVVAEIVHAGFVVSCMVSLSNHQPNGGRLAYSRPPETVSTAVPLMSELASAEKADLNDLHQLSIDKGQGIWYTIIAQSRSF